jgi:hypothetical protein
MIALLLFVNRNKTWYMKNEITWFYERRVDIRVNRYEVINTSIDSSRRLYTRVRILYNTFTLTADAARTALLLSYEYMWENRQMFLHALELRYRHILSTTVYHYAIMQEYICSANLCWRAYKNAENNATGSQVEFMAQFGTKTDYKCGWHRNGSSEDGRWVKMCRWGNAPPKTFLSASYILGPENP